MSALNHRHACSCTHAYMHARVSTHARAHIFPPSRARGNRRNVSVADAPSRRTYAPIHGVPTKTAASQKGKHCDGGGRGSNCVYACDHSIYRRLNISSFLPTLSARLQNLAHTESTSARQPANSFR